MNYPLISEYIESIRNAEDNFNELSNLRPVFDNNGNPIMSSGNFAVVFKVEDCKTNKAYALKCFTKEQEGRKNAYQQITKELGLVHSEYLCSIKYFENELFVDSYNSTDSEFPIVLMDWIDGVSLDKYIITHKYNAGAIENIVLEFYKLSCWLRKQSFAHGDLKPDNILVTHDGKLVLVDYDGMYVPAMKGQIAREHGTPEYQLPEYINSLIRSFNNEIDDFAIIHILLSLKLYSVMPSMICESKDFAIFSASEFGSILESNKYKTIVSKTSDNELFVLLSLFVKMCNNGKLSTDDWNILKIEKSKCSFTDMEKSMCCLDNIILAIELAYHSMLYKDPARYEKDINFYKPQFTRLDLAISIQISLKNHTWNFEDGLYYNCLKPNGSEIREGIALPLSQYALRYLYGIVRYKAFHNDIDNKNIFGGNEDVFIVNHDNNKYETYFNAFVEKQEKSSKLYNSLYVFDIRNFFNCINLERMQMCFFQNCFINTDWYDSLFSEMLSKYTVSGLNPCSEIDFYFANIYMQDFDKKIREINDIEYYRYGDDIRIFSNSRTIMYDLKEIINETLHSMSLELNEKKTKYIDTTQDKQELSKAYFIYSCTLYYNKSNEQVIQLDGKTLAYIVENDLSFAYLFELFKVMNERVCLYNGSAKVHLNNLFYLLKNVHKNATLYRMTCELLFDFGKNFSEDPLTFSYILEEMTGILNNNKVEDFVKYWILRVFFFNENEFYKYYKSEENRWKNSYYYTCSMDIIHDFLKTSSKNNNSPLLAHISDCIIKQGLLNDLTWTELP